MQIKFVSVMVKDQERALQFYTGVLGFAKMADLPVGESRWLTVTSPDGVDGVELVLEPITQYVFAPPETPRRGYAPRKIEQGQSTRR